MGKQDNIAEQLASAKAAIDAARGPGDRAIHHADIGKERPLPEQAHKFGDRAEPVRTEKGQVVGRAYRRRPYFETLAQLPANAGEPNGPRLIDAQGLAALRFYRSQWEGSQASETRCALDVEGVGGGVPGSRIHEGVMTSDAVRRCDKDLLALGETMRAVALHDMSFAAVAMMRWGSRDRQRVVIGAGKQKPKIVKQIVPRSSQHPDIIREEFLSGLKILTRSVGAHLSV